MLELTIDRDSVVPVRRSVHTRILSDLLLCTFQSMLAGAMAVKTEIAIRDPLPIYTCGHVIKGAVYIRSPESVVVVEDLLVQLLCKVITRTRPKDGLVAANKHGNHRTVSIPYCFVTRLISQPKHVAANEPFEFEFTIPFETKRNEIEPQWFASALFEQSAGHAIPPTWEDRLGRAKVMHGLEVVMHTANAGGGGSQKTISGREIIFMPCRAVEFPDARCIVVNRMLQAKISRSDIFQNDQLRHKKSFVQLLTPDEKHPVEIQIKVQSPTVLHSGGPVPISISVPLDQYSRHQRPLTPPEDSPPASPILHPAIFVDRMYAYLAVRTYRRIKAGTTEQVLFGDDQIPICNVVDRPVEISKYCVGVASLGLDVPSNPWRRTMRSYFDGCSGPSTCPSH